MSCLGVHFSLSADEAERLRTIEEESERVEYLQEELEEDYFNNHPEWIAESDKAWDAMHRALSGGELTWDGGEYPLNHVILGGERLCNDTGYIMILKTPKQVHDVATALGTVTADEFRRRYNGIDAWSYYGELSEEDFEYTWSTFQEVRTFWMRAAKEGRYVLFTADQ